MISQQYDTIIFDLGGVIINIDPPATFYALQELFQQEITPESLRFEDYEKGTFSEEEYIRFLQNRFGRFSKEAFFNAWNAMLLDIPSHRIELIRQLKEKHTIWLLSNTNITHIREIEHMLQQQFNTNFGSLFDHRFLSYEMKMRKPEKEIYMEVQKHVKEGQRAVFLDDNQDNVYGSEQSGLPAVLVDRDIKEIFVI